MPPLKGIYFSNQFYNYDGSAAASKEFEFGGIVVAGVHVEYPLDFPAVLFVPTTDLFGGTAAWNVNIGDRPATVRVRGFHEVEAVNRFEGSAVFLQLSFPISVETPPAPPPGAAHP